MRGSLDIGNFVIKKKHTNKETEGNFLKGKGEHQRMVEKNECLKKKN